MTPDRNLSLPRQWPDRVKAATLHVVSLAHLAITHTRGWCINGSPITRHGLVAERDQAEDKISLLTEMMRIKDARMAGIPAHKRPHYAPTERMAILEVRAAQAWSLGETARAFLVESNTIATWTKRVDEQGPDALVQMADPVNKFPDFVRRTVARLKTLCPTMGKTKIAQHLARAGLHLCPNTVKNMLKKPAADPNTNGGKEKAEPKKTKPAAKPRVVTAKRPNHVWHSDLTLVPTAGGFWVPWIPNALLQFWPFAFWVLVVTDHFSRRVLRLQVFKNQPTSVQVRTAIGQTIAQIGTAPKYLILDHGSQFDNPEFQAWCEKRHGIQPRYGAVGQYGGLAVVERFIRSMKTECTRRILIPLRREKFAHELSLYQDWFDEHRPHQGLKGRTPNEVYFGRRLANTLPRLEPRARWPRPSPCAAPQTLVKGNPGVRLELEVSFQNGRRHLPIVTLRRAS